MISLATSYKNKLKVMRWIPGLVFCIAVVIAYASAAQVRLPLSSEPQLAYAVYNEASQDFHLSNEEPDKKLLVAKANFTNGINQTGWSTFEVWSNINYPDSLQARAAGFLEGFLTHDLIYWHYHNTMIDYCKDREDYCTKLRKYLSRNNKWVMKSVEKLRGKNAYWHQVGLFYEQLDGLAKGWRKAAEKTGYKLDAEAFLWLNINGDMEDLEVAFKAKERKSTFKDVNGRVLGSGSCSALIKVLPENQDLLVSHVTWNAYQSMLRILKNYRLFYRSAKHVDSPLIRGHALAFSSYPGVLFSIDDFTVSSAGMVILETTIGNSNDTLWKHLHPTGQVLEGIRATVANRLAPSADRWTQIFSEYNSGTYNNQWMVVDYKRFKPGFPIFNDTLWVLEQLPGHIVASDVSWRLRNETYWPSYNSPFYPEIFSLSGTPKLVEKYGDWFSYDKTPRALIFRRDHGKVTDITSMMKLMRYNNYQHDPLSKCDCTPPYSAENAISARNDLNPRNGTYPFPALSHRSHGGTDAKITSFELLKRMRFLAVSGPTYDDLPPFDWRKSDFDVPHVGLPDLWQFKPVETQWSFS